MPKFDVTIKQTIEVYGELTVSAKDEDVAREKVQAMIADLTIPEMQWSVESSGKKDFAWDAPDGVVIEIDEVNEE